MHVQWTASGVTRTGRVVGVAAQPGTLTLAPSWQILVNVTIGPNIGAFMVVDSSALTRFGGDFGI